MNVSKTEWIRGLGVWLASWGLYTWLGGPSLQFLWMLISSLMIKAVMLGAFGPRKITVRREITPGTLHAGDEAEVRLDVKFQSLLPLPWILLTADIGGQRINRLWFPGFRRSVSDTFIVRLSERGVWPEAEARVEWGDMFGWFRFSRPAAGMDGLTVLPRPSVLRGMMDYRAGDEGEEQLASPERAAVYGRELRDYIPGDPLNRIHWKNSARTGRLQSMTPQSGDEGSRLVVLDASLKGYSGCIKPEVVFEEAVSAAAGLLRSLYPLYSINGAKKKTGLLITGDQGLSVRHAETASLGEPSLLPLAEVRLGGGPAADELLKASAVTDADELIIITGNVEQPLAEIAARLLEAGVKLGVYCIIPAPGQPAEAPGEDMKGRSEPERTLGNALPEVLTPQLTSDLAPSDTMQPNLVGPAGHIREALAHRKRSGPEQRLLEAGGRLFYVMSGYIHEVPRGRGKGGSYEQYIR